MNNIVTRMNGLNKVEVDEIINRLQLGHPIPDDFKNKLFPVKHKEYELAYGGKMRREDILGNEDGVVPVPLQIEKIFNGKRKQWKDQWRNIVAFGDNLQFLKTLYENKDPLIKDKVKGKIKLIYIDPPFATEGDFKSTLGQKAYTDKTKGADFIEFLRRRLVVARELLSIDGCIFVHLDYRYKHHIKIVLDEIFGEGNFKNEIIVSRTKKNIKERERVKKLNEEFDTILLFSKTEEFSILPPTRNDYKPDRWHGFEAAGYRNGMDYSIFGKTPSKRDSHWRWTEDKAKIAAKNYKKWEKEYSVSETLGDYYRRNLENNIDLQFLRPKPSSDMPEYFIASSEKSLVNNMWNDITVSSFEYDYPTEKSEKLLKRVIEAVTKEGDLVMDFFGGSGTTAATAEKLNRKWITCDVGKLAFYTIQKRLLNISSSKSITPLKKSHQNEAKSFITVNTGCYDLAKVFQLQQKEYCEFVMKLFEVEPKKSTISGIGIDGEKKDGYNVIVWPFWKVQDSLVDEEYLENLHSHLGSRAGKRVYIIAPANCVDFISDYFPIDKVRYYFLKVPYHVIGELHKVQFKKFRQPQSKSKVNDLEDAIGFHFIRQPDVQSELKAKGDSCEIVIKKFISNFTEEESYQEMENYESLAMVLVDKDFNGSEFDMDHCYFAEELRQKSDSSLAENNQYLRGIKQIAIPKFLKSECGERLMLIYIDIYGNEFKEEFKLKK
jgi:site-specific DNA-methyltransferase (adenine-specific)/adenine-specific DNA-methyltransferase